MMACYAPHRADTASAHENDNRDGGSMRLTAFTEPWRNGTAYPTVPVSRENLFKSIPKDLFVTLI